MGSDSRDYRLELSSAGEAAEDEDKGGAAGRPFLSVLFKCCSVYTRIYRSADGKSYSGRCPKCATPIQFKVGEEGSSSRFFVVE
jgi:hypothetical protein